MEVGGKRNLLEFARIAISFAIPTGIVYDEDSSEVPADQEATYNSALDSLVQEDGLMKVWRLRGNYEDHVRLALGELQYRALCQKCSGMGKPTKARLIAAEQGLPIPEPFDSVLSWLANMTTQVSAGT